MDLLVLLATVAGLASPFVRRDPPLPSQGYAGKVETPARGRRTIQIQNQCYCQREISARSDPTPVPVPVPVPIPGRDRGLGPPPPSSSSPCPAMLFLDPALAKRPHTSPRYPQGCLCRCPIRNRNTTHCGGRRGTSPSPSSSSMGCAAIGARNRANGTGSGSGTAGWQPAGRAGRALVGSSHEGRPELLSRVTSATEWTMLAIPMAVLWRLWGL